jgi:uncharacterized repeat protein (TIGR03809 family)
MQAYGLFTFVSRLIGSAAAAYRPADVVAYEWRGMSAAFYQTPIEAVRRWHALAERRRNYIVELYRSDRWRRYYGEDAFRTLMRDVIQNAETWSKVLEDMHGAAPASSANAIPTAKDLNGAAPVKSANGVAPAKPVVAPAKPIGGVAARAA